MLSIILGNSIRHVSEDMIDVREMDSDVFKRRQDQDFLTEPSRAEAQSQHLSRYEPSSVLSNINKNSMTELDCVLHGVVNRFDKRTEEGNLRAIVYVPLASFLVQLVAEHTKLGKFALSMECKTN